MKWNECSRQIQIRDRPRSANQNKPIFQGSIDLKRPILFWLNRPSKVIVPTISGPWKWRQNQP